MRAAIDHLVVTAPSLAEGADYIRAELGVEMHPGGEHRHMGTHNLLLKLDDVTYLEVLAINPEAPRPRGPRWFGLDGVVKPGLAAWVARVDDIHAAVAAAPGEFGEVMQMGRGTLTWLIALRIVADSSSPALIQWLSGPHPASKLPDSGCTLVDLTTISMALVATFQTPSGTRTLRTTPAS
ncbi:MAG TPA: VOC family protein [Candidatus Krumholzibacteria bacterium]|nr:VOC family protein [Candidatus Krumholzibacteria bacterium]